MNKTTLLLLVIFVSSTFCMACPAAHSANRQQEKGISLRFNKDKTFKVMQFTDLHLSSKNENEDNRSVKTIARMEKIVKAEKPDVIILTGDNVTEAPAKPMWGLLLSKLEDLKTPFVLLFGNHDAEQELSREEMSRMVVANRYSLNTLNEKGELADLDIPVLGSDGGKVEAALYCLDSHDYSTLEGIEGYGWFTQSQIDWVRERCLTRTAENDGKHLLSLAYFHIPLVECETSWSHHGNSRVGIRGENECPGVLNTGMFATMIETGNILGVFSGHDHDNDYMVGEQGIAIGYGRFSGSHNTYTHLRPGARIVILEEGKRVFKTYIREEEERCDDTVYFQDNKFIEEK